MTSCYAKRQVRHYNTCHTILISSLKINAYCITFEQVRLWVFVVKTTALWMNCMMVKTGKGGDNSASTLVQ